MISDRRAIRGISDCHMHVFGPPDEYPGAANRTYTPSLMGLETYRPIAERLGIERIVIVQPSAYGVDNRATLAGVREWGANARAVAVIDESIADEELRAMDRQGVRGVRLNLLTAGVSRMDVAEAALLAAASRIEKLGWHIQIYADLSFVAKLAPAVRRCPVPVVFDHMGGAKTTTPVEGGDFRTLLELLGEGRCWVKLSGADIVTDFETRDFSRASAIAKALVAANPRQLVWGTDWPHLVHFHEGIGDQSPPAGFRPVEEEALLNSLGEWAADAETWTAILVDNPARLYGF